MKILHIINTLAYGGAQSVLVQLLEGWGEEKDQHIVISLRGGHALSSRIQSLNIPVRHINLLPNQIESAKFLKLILMIKEYKPDIVQTWLYHADLIGSIATRLVSRAPILWGVHHTLEGRNSVKRSTWAVVRILSQLSTVLPSDIICCSQSAYQTHLACGYAKKKMEIILNGIDTYRFKPDPNARANVQAELGLFSGTKMIGMFARFHPQKDHHTLIRAAQILLKRNPDVHFVLAGEGIDQSNKQLMDQISQLGIATNLHLLGSRQDMPRLNAAMNIVTLTSAFGEAQPMVLGEAMACGTPCVATNVGDTATLIDHTGLVVEPGNPPALADAWQKILESSELEYNALGSQARARVLGLYNLTNMIKKYKAVYQGLMAPQ